MNTFLQYKGYTGSVEYSAQDEVLHGKLLFIRDLVTYEAQDVKALKQAFNEAVKDYLEDCKVREVAPEKPLKGSFNVRVSPEIHRKAALLAKAENISLNKVVERALEHELV